LVAGQTYPYGTSPKEAGISYDDRTIKGHGVDVKAGVIVRPIEESPFRIGLSLSSPTWYRLKTHNETEAYVDNQTSRCWEDYEFKYSTPWVVGVSLGHTIENMLALGLSYNYTIFSSADMRYLTNTGYSGDESRSDTQMNDEIGASLRGTHTLKVGAELKPDPAFAVRIGYNFISSPYRSDDEAYRNQKVYSPGVYYASTTDYVNWKPTHRITAGFGTKIGKFGIDLAYQYQVTRGDMFPFTDGEYYEDDSYYIENMTPATSVTFARHQVLLTLGYAF
jgi:long-subunit fatty acid transport protein